MWIFFTSLGANWDQAAYYKISSSIQLIKLNFLHIIFGYLSKPFATEIAKLLFLSSLKK